MTLKLYTYKKDPKTGKNVKTGGTETIGNVSRGSAGGYTQGPITGLAPTGKTDIRGQPVYGQPQAPVPNNYYMENNANTSTNQGPVYNPLPTALQSPSMPLPPGSPVVPTSSAPAAQGAPNQPQTLGERMLNAVKGRMQEELYATKGISAGGYQPPPGTEFSAPIMVPGVGSAAKVAAKQAALKTVEKGAVKNIANMEKVGAQVMAPGGAETLSATIPEAAGVLKSAAPEAGKIAWSSRTLLQKDKYIKTVASTFLYPTILAGGIYGLVKSSEAGESAVDSDLTQFTGNFPKDIVTLQEAGYFDEAEEVRMCAEGVRDALESGAFDNAFTGKSKGTKALNVCKTQLNEGLLQVEKDKAAKAKQAILDAQAAEAAATAAKANEEQQRLDFQRQQQEDQQAFQTSEREARQAYELQSRSQAAIDAERLAATETIEGSGSTLQFGLLGTGGAREFVNKDRASQVYFQKSYEELTPEQKMLLNLLKGGN